MMNKLKHTIKLFIVVIVCALSFTTQAQQTENGTNYFQLSPRIGYDFPSYNNNTPAIDYKGGLDLGLSLDYYLSIYNSFNIWTVTSSHTTHYRNTVVFTSF